MPSNMERLEQIAAELPEAERVDIEEWGGHPTFRVRGKNFVFSDLDATGISLKLSKDEAAAVVATDSAVTPASYGLGRHGWVGISIDVSADAQRWVQLREWIRTSYTLVAPRKLARIVEEQDA
ncbi:MmcQ/YjbR family DNA-binding protein [Antrihabitans stalactiti]|uniref:MmcQ/YjbR family DNA-binding protein n=1 Tax=Antrihabitans stalactiti TaxID=2584121 RepID=A0A848KEA4_9NOCA|nr:MmcQ/YjbR family DNA-binding protein [Antrihabitans stalactiti]NMN97155.1 MmcQ/YjbR family DNA-binding protein [Antrihabitans stalactiti]